MKLTAALIKDGFYWDGTNITSRDSAATAAWCWWRTDGWTNDTCVVDWSDATGFPKSSYTGNTTGTFHWIGGSYPHQNYIRFDAYSDGSATADGGTSGTVAASFVIQTHLWIDGTMQY